MNEPLPSLLLRAAAHAEAGGSACACLVVKARGSTPHTAGALMLVDDAAQSFGTIGGGCVEAEVRRRAFEMLSAGERGVLRFKLDHDYGWDDGLICGGTLEIAVGDLPEPRTLRRIAAEIEGRRATRLPIATRTADGAARYVLDLPERERLVIAGAGHIGQAVARLALGLEFDVTVVDDRRDLLDRYLPPGARHEAGEIAERLAALPIDGGTYVLVVTRGHRHDEQALHAVVDRGARYVGMIGSRRKVKLIFDDLRAMGVAESALAHVHAPVGLDIGAVSVEEIAVSIVAQLVAARRAERRSAVIGPETAHGAPAAS